MSLSAEFPLLKSARKDQLVEFICDFKGKTGVGLFVL